MGKRVEVKRLSSVAPVDEGPELPGPGEVGSESEVQSAGALRREPYVSITLQVLPADREALLRSAMEQRIQRGYGQTDMSRVAREVLHAWRTQEQ